jgi:hypothetical protein
MIRTAAGDASVRQPGPHGYYGGFSQSLKDSLPDLQVIRPGLGESTAVIPGLRAVIRL